MPESYVKWNASQYYFPLFGYSNEMLDLGLSLLERSVKENGQHSKGPIHTGTLCQQIRLLSGGSLCQSPVSRWLTGLMQSRHSFGWKDSCKHLPNVVRLLLNWPIYYPCVPSLRRSMETA